MRKEERQRLIELLIGRKELSTQAELVAALAESGCTVTQATVSRDMREMGVRKGSDRGGRVRYMMPPPRVRRDPEELLARVLAESAATVRAARNLVVIRSEPGTASNVGRAIDELENDDLIGTVAGDDTGLLVLADEAAAGRMEDYLEEMIR